MTNRKVWIPAIALPPASEQHVINVTVGGDEYHNEVTLALEPESVIEASELRALVEAGQAMRDCGAELGAPVAETDAWDAALKRLEGKL